MRRLLSSRRFCHSLTVRDRLRGPRRRRPGVEQRFALQPEHLVRHHGLRAPFHRDLLHGPRNDVILHDLVGVLADEDVRAKVLRRGLEAEGATADEDALEALCAASAGDARSALNTLEVAVALARAKGRAADKPASVHVDLDGVAAARDRRIFHQGVDEHYDQASALIKSVRGSDPDAGLYWLARMIESGEDPRFLARRLVILASEDVGMADPLALVVADAASRAVEVVGMPEAALNLAQCVVYLATAPKSNRVTVALGRATEDFRAGTRGEVPNHLRDGHSPNAAGKVPSAGGAGARSRPVAQ